MTIIPTTLFQLPTESPQSAIRHIIPHTATITADTEREANCNHCAHRHGTAQTTARNHLLLLHATFCARLAAAHSSLLIRDGTQSKLVGISAQAQGTKNPKKLKRNRHSFSLFLVTRARLAAATKYTNKAAIGAKRVLVKIGTRSPLTGFYHQTPPIMTCRLLLCMSTMLIKCFNNRVGQLVIEQGRVAGRLEKIP